MNTLDKWVVFDVDDVICNFRESLYQSLKKRGINIPWQEWSHYNHVKMFNFNDEKELHLHMAQHSVLENSLVEKEALSVMLSLKQKGYKIGLLTARAWHTEGQLITQAFIEKYNLPIDKLVISGQHMDRKSAHIDKFQGVVEYYIDDSIHHIQDFLSHQVRAILMNRPWNQEVDLERVASLTEFNEKIPSLHLKNKHKM